MTWWLNRHWRASWAALTVLLIAALMLTPTNAGENISTLAPALIVAVFEGLIHGPDAAMPALKPLLAMMGLAVVLALILRLSVFRTRGEKTPATSETEEAA
jgi:hypothetical protein